MSTQRFHVYGIGNAIIDLQLRAKDEDLQQLGLQKAGMQLVEVEDQEKLLSYFSGQVQNRASGGSAANTVIALAQLGGKAAYGCLVGDDALGRFYLDEMKELGVEITTAPRPASKTGTCVILITPDAERTMNTHLGASAYFSADQVSEDLISRSDWLYIEGYLFASEPGQGAIERAIELARRHETKIAITFSDGFIVEVFNDAVRKATEFADLVFANTNEACKFTGKADEREAFAELQRRVPNVVMTMSERGALVSYNGAEQFIEAVPTKAVDDTGAGDMFAGGFLYGITHGRTAADSARLACALASRVVSQLGPRLSGDVRKLAESLG